MKLRGKEGRAGVAAKLEVTDDEAIHLAKQRVCDRWERTKKAPAKKHTPIVERA